MKAYIPSILYFLSAALFLGAVFTSNMAFLMGGAIFMFAASILTKMINKN